MVNFANIPLDITNEILSYLSVEGFCALRLTCDALRRNTLDAFSRRYFKERTVILTSLSSLQDLTEVSSHPTLSPCIRTLKVDSQVFGGASLEGHEERFLEVLGISNHVYHDHLEAAMEIHNRNLDKRDLTLALSKLRSLHTINVENPAIYGTSQRPVWEIYRKGFEGQEWRVLKVVFDAIAAAGAVVGLTLRELSVENFFYGGPRSPLLLDGPDTQSFTSLSCGLKSLRTLRMKLSASDCPDQDDWVSTLLGATSELKTLDLSFNRSYLNSPQLYFQSIAAETHMSHLTTCNLHNSRLRERHLKQFFTTHKATLRELRLCHVVLRGGSWGSLLQHVRENLNLKRLILSSVYNQVGHLHGVAREEVHFVVPVGDAWDEVCKDDDKEFVELFKDKSFATDICLMRQIGDGPWCRVDGASDERREVIWLRERSDRTLRPDPFDYCCHKGRMYAGLARYVELQGEEIGSSLAELLANGNYTRPTRGVDYDV